MKNRLSDIRKHCGIRQQEMACMLGVSRQTLSSIENGHWDPSIKLAYKIARFFGKPIEEVFLFDEKWEVEEPAR